MRRVHNPPQFFHPIHTILSLCFSLSALSCRSCILLPLYLSPSLFLLLLSPNILYLCLSRIRATSFSSVFLVPSSFSASLFSPLIPYPLFLARFISAQCQFEFGTWTTGQRVSTKNQFLNARLFRAEEPVCIFPSLLFPYFFMPLYYIRQDATSKHRLADVRIRD